ncbi:Ankyrin Repeat [Seminavis robusta]|uniref:Ankyrin Repeat n=1 Tax=Seminavis robusta TaxID=568900 RepID=A0A9N8E2Y9_9STRA|nr:Ankyrin Repeat [Seminavis robusta]|eukprot:Sro490_g153600.1 Ankyrin Repeat (409) ;mRNA; r:57334-58805
MGVINALQSRIRPLRQRREANRQLYRGDVFLKDEATILEYVRRRPKSCSRKYIFKGERGKRYPLLFLCCQSNVSLAVVKAVHEAYPEAMAGALHYSLRNRQKSLAVIQYLLESTPDKWSEEESGYLPLHTALQNMAALDIVQYLMKQHPKAVQMRETSARSHKLPLHLAIQNFATLNVIKLLVSAYPKALKEADYETTEVVEEEGWLVHKATFMFDDGVGLPLHAACKAKRPLQTIHYLVNHYPNSVSTKNRAGWLPLHFACAYGAPPVMIEYLITACPESLFERTNYLFTEYPTHLAAGRPDADLETIKLLIGKHPVVPNVTPDSSIYSSYMDESYLHEAHPMVIRFLRRVVEASESGYAYLPTQEERFWATTARGGANEHKDDQEEQEKGTETHSTEDLLLLGQIK